MSEEQPSHHHQPNERTERLRRGYERMLERLKEAFPNTELRVLTLREHLENAKQRVIALGELSREEAEEVQEYLRRDLEDAGDWLADHSNSSDARDWLQMDLQMIETWLWDAFSSAADWTRIQLESFATTGEPAIYRTGEITAPGRLACLVCSRTLEFTRVGHIPPCPGCRATEFVRAPRAETGDASE